MTIEHVLNTINQAAENKWTKLNFSSRRLSMLPPEIGQLLDLQELDLGFNQLNKLPPEIGQLANLTKLCLNNNSLGALPPEIGKLINLQELDLSSNKLTRLPLEVGQLTNLMELYLHNNLLNSLPAEIGRLSSLESLDLSCNQLKVLPQGIFYLTNLRELDLHDNLLSVFPAEMGRLTALQGLVFSFNQIHSLPPEIGQLTNLRVLNLKSNQLQLIPIEIGRLFRRSDTGENSGLEEFDLSYNQLQTIPTEIGNLQNLTVFYLNANQLQDIPAEIGNLENLTHLYLQNNQLFKMPLEINQLTNLQELVIIDNPLPIPPEILQKTYDPVAIITYHHQQQIAAERRLLNEAKMLLVGQGDVGKTCLANRLIYDTFQEENTTEGINIFNWEVTAPTPDRDKIRLNVWDFGGQEIYHATHQFFLTKRSVYLLVWNARKSKDYEHIFYWLHTIEAFGEDSPIILVMTKCNERDDDLNLKNLKEKFPQIVGLYKVDNLDGKGISTLKEIIAKTAWNLPHMRTNWVNTWLTIRQKLENDGRNWITYDEFQKICHQENLDKKQTEVLDEYLHDLGVIIHFRHNIRIKNMVILKPEWATKAVYKVLDTQSIRNREGVLYHDELSQIWDTNIYPATLFPSLLEMMAEFQLVYELPNKKSHLVAELLPSTESDFFWDATDNLRFYYNYDFIPAGVITRFIVLIHPHLELTTKNTHLCWHEGCVLQWENTRAVVRVLKVERIIEICIQGQKQRELLAIIRHYFDYINQSIKKIKITQEIPCNCTSGCSNKFNYQRLIEAEQKDKATVECQTKWEDVSLSSLLDGYQRKEERLDNRTKAPPPFPNSIVQVKDQATVVFGYQEKIDLSKQVKNMTKQEKIISIGAGAHVSAPVVIADSIENSFNALKTATLDDGIKQLLKELLQATTDVNKQVSEGKAEEAEAMARDAESLIKEVTSSKPRRRWYEISLEGLKQAATNLGEIADPVLAIVKKLTPLLLS